MRGKGSTCFSEIDKKILVFIGEINDANKYQ